MDKDAITEFLLENGLSDVDIVKEGENYVTMSFFYDFDKNEIDAARSYATEEGDYDESSIEWYSEFFLPYLTDIATDNVSDILGDLADEFSCEFDMKQESLDASGYDSMKFYVALSDEELDTDSQDYF